VKITPDEVEGLLVHVGDVGLVDIGHPNDLVIGEDKAQAPQGGTSRYDVQLGSGKQVTVTGWNQANQGAPPIATVIVDGKPHRFAYEKADWREL